LKIGLLTGTFDPVHLGHVAMGRAALSQLDLGGVWMLVNAQPAHKAGVLPYEHRLEMARLAVADEAGFEAVEWPEGHRLEEFERLMGQHPGHEFVFIVGMDTMARLDRWQEYERIIEGQKFVVAQRAGVSDRTLDELKGRLGPGLGERLRAQVFAFDDYASASSGLARQQLAEGVDDALLDAKVAAYIRRHGLYGAH
jgi:nicotinate-nucleotide adenylyltransferase